MISLIIIVGYFVTRTISTLIFRHIMRSTQPHYDNGNSYDVIDVINDYNINFCRGNIIKYVIRAGKKKDELQDLLKSTRLFKQRNRTNKTK